MPAPTKKTRKKAAQPAILYCSFCKKSQHHVRKLIAGPDGLTICDECITLSNEIINEEALARAAQDDETWKQYLAARSRSISRDASDLHELLASPRPNVHPHTGQPRSDE